MDPQSGGSKLTVEEITRLLIAAMLKMQLLPSKFPLSSCISDIKNPMSEEVGLDSKKQVQNALHHELNLAFQPPFSREFNIVKLRYVLLKKLDEVSTFSSILLPIDPGPQFHLRVALCGNDRSNHCEPARCFIKFRVGGNHDDEVVHELFILAGTVLLVDHNQDVYTVAFEDKRMPRKQVGVCSLDAFEILWDDNYKCTCCLCAGHTQSRCPFLADSPPVPQEKQRIQSFNEFDKKRISKLYTSGKSSLVYPMAKVPLDKVAKVRPSVSLLNERTTISSLRRRFHAAQDPSNRRNSSRRSRHQTVGPAHC